MTTIYLIRHAEAEGNLYRIAQGQDNSILTDLGWQQIRALERRFAEIPVDAVYASDLYRTCATASAIYRPKGLPLHRRRDLREICVGVWEQKTWGEIARRDPEQLEDFNRRLHLWHVEGAETPQAVQARMLAAVREIAAANDGRTVAVFSHGCAIRLTLAALQGIPLEELGRTPTGSNTAVSLLRAEGADIEVVYRDDARHLTDPACTRGLTLKKRANGLEPGLYFEPLPPELTEFPAACAGRTPDLPACAAVLTGYLNGTPVGAVAFDEGREAAEGCGWIPLLAVAEPWRRRGYGVQFIGQAVMHYRPLGRDRLRLPAPETEAAERFCREFGFSPADDGRAWEKDIGYDPEFLGT
ncbi:GNAT family N-acetyltransferase [Oscillibacter valericigenes]|uniref:GNAT family N-acetyltransferase n=1 Tax=Oscillibacter valericigenes TaxID=351091 RepID=A0ABS2FV74_9FIRM|nr:bifunctional histidine phosphatase family protein/GNAT family N-acetyltransferase [Oscillibacter valericigenes]MBM6851260.1 GNAT family N-acetyltransferase [Oscillibacter valericigenes]